MLGIYYIKTYRAGESGYYEGRKHGKVAVWNDSKLYLYRQPPKSFRKQFKDAIRSAFCTDGEKLTGTWPEYRIN